MPIHPITLSGKLVKPHRSVLCPEFKAKAAHVSDRFQYVDMWLRQSGQPGKDAIVYWRQAANFFKANMAVDSLAKPLTSYYCLLNMVKALLAHSGKGMAGIRHGVSGYSTGTKAALSNEIVKFKGGGVLPELCDLLGDAVVGDEEVNLLDLLYNLPHIHRAYCMTIPSRSKRELYIPLANCGFYRIDGSKETYFRGDLTQNWDTPRTKSKLPAGFEFDLNSISGSTGVRRKKRFKWGGKSEKTKIEALLPYHKKIRKRVFHIHDAPGYWYLKRDADSGVADGLVEKSPTVISFAAMHRLSELSRYDPDKLSRHFANRYGWLLNEFLARTLDQLLDDIASEITGREVL